MKDARDIVKRPIITEKSYDLMNEGKFTFEVDKKANKIEVKQACEALFNVKVEKVNIVNVLKNVVLDVMKDSSLQ